jgi:CheY-like chemotaxis protein
MNSSKPILLIEHNENNAKDTKKVLDDIHVTNALEHKSNIDEAYEYLRDEKKPKPCVVLLDLNMPRMGAFEFIKTIKADHLLKRIPIIVLLSCETNGEVAQSSGLDIAGYITKPFDYKQFIEVVKGFDIHWSLNRKQE